MRIWRPRLLRPGLEHEPDLHRDDRQPEGVDAWRIRRQHEPEHRTLRLKADRHAALFAVARRQHVEREPARQRRQDAPHLGQHEPVLLHVGPAHPLGQARARRLGARELLGRLRPIAHRQRRVHVELAGVADAGDEIVNRNLAQHLASARRLAHVAPDQPAVGTTDPGDRLAGREVNHVVHFHARVRLSPTKNR